MTISPEPPNPNRSATQRKQRRGLLVSAAAITVAAIIGAGLYYRARAAQPLTDKDTVVIADFANRTADPVFDDTLKTALTVALNQSSPFLDHPARGPGRRH